MRRYESVKMSIIKLDKYLNSSVIVLASVVLYVTVSLAFYDRYPTEFWFVSAFFILFTAEHLYNAIGRSEVTAVVNLKNTVWHKLISCFSPAVLVAITWCLAGSS